MSEGPKRWVFAVTLSRSDGRPLDSQHARAIATTVARWVEPGGQHEGAGALEIVEDPGVDGVPALVSVNAVGYPPAVTPEGSRLWSDLRQLACAEGLRLEPPEPPLERPS